VAFIVYDITKKDTFVRAQDIVRNVKKQNCSGAVIALVGNKLDLESEREISTEDGMAYANRNALHFYEVSAKINQNIDLLFISIAECLAAQHILAK